MNKTFLFYTSIYIVVTFWSCVIAQNTNLISDGSAFEVKAFYPKFSWDTTPMYYMFGDPKRVLLPEEVAHIAKRTDFICIEKSHGEAQLGAAELGAKHEVATFKKVKPEMKVLFYFNSAYAWPFTSYNKAFVQKKIDQHPELKKFLIVDPETKELAKRGSTYFFDVLNPEFRDWWVNTVAKGVEFSGADGAFIDQMHGFSWLRQDRSKEVQKAMGDMMTALKTKLGPDKILLGNNAHTKSAQYVFPVIDANMFEHYSNDLLSKEKLLQDWEDMLRIAKAGKMSIFRIGVEYDSVTVANEEFYKGKMRNERFAALSKEKIEYYHACYLIGAQPYSYFQYGWGWQLAHGSLLDYPELEKPLGKPKGSFVRKSADSWEFTRHFEHASVWVNTETGKAHISWY
ncbi:putative glycoside hydrolase [Mariniflexile sp. AS56]|uniref:putative glycoside hydrolase n=1 Tax=Mariniflexile sp. AS56 TaxID=3063957 RepID=UPI0026F1B0A3|nr:putative glycoside hydrolase [Mariniflexile sp. AS56]MDO7172402.1 putative glycoside hydrolase [Mariniflexile sp. AS56]